MPTIQANDDTKLFYREIGAGPRAVVLVHGWMVSGAVYDALLETLDHGGLRLIVPDLRGTGESGKPERGFTLARYAADVMAIADHARLDRFVVVGHSMGGQIAQWIAAEHPARVAGMVLLCPVPAAGMPLPADATNLFRGSGGSRELQGTILGLACKDLAPSAKERLLDVAGAISPTCIAESFDAWSKGGFEDRLTAITAPTLVVASDDPFLTPDLLRASVVNHIARARLAKIPGAGHYVQVERTHETAAVLEAFLAALPS